jgi:hypothetical protein
LYSYGFKVNLHSYGFLVACGECGREVLALWADTPYDGIQGRGLCDVCRVAAAVEHEEEILLMTGSISLVDPEEIPEEEDEDG